jgi:hypothetical protein
MGNTMTRQFDCRHANDQWRRCGSIPRHLFQATGFVSIESGAQLEDEAGFGEFLREAL